MSNFIEWMQHSWEFDAIINTEKQIRSTKKILVSQKIRQISDHLYIYTLYINQIIN
jgi:hypothetical protein